MLPLIARPLCKMAAASHGMTRRVSERALRKDLRRIKGCVFDMDGTLTVPVIDFVEMRRRVGVPPPADILDVINSWPEDERKWAHDQIADIELQALRDMQLMPGVLELCELLDARRVPRALLTRNVSASVDFFHRTHFTLPPFMPAISREAHFYKPDPACMHHIAKQWGLESSQLVIIGDSAKDDIVCGNRAGAATVLLDTQGRYDQEELEGEERPDYLVTSLHQVAELLAELLVDEL